MKRFVTAAALLASACSPGDPTGPAAGKAYFTQAGCAACHKIGAEGNAVGPDLTTIGWRYSPEWLDGMLKDPKAWKANTLMPNPRLSVPARKAIVAYLAGLQGQDWPKGARPWDVSSLINDPVARGRAIYARAGCIGCHGAGGAGGYPNNNVAGGLIPSLTKLSESYSQSELREKIKNGAIPIPNDRTQTAPLVIMPAWGEQLGDAELDAVASYLLALPPNPTAKADW